MLETDRLIKTTRFVVRAAFLVNRLFLAAVALGLLVSYALPSQFAMVLIHKNPQTDLSSEMAGLRLMMTLGIAMSVAIDRLLLALMQIIETVRTGDPFISANARRLQTIGWALLSLQLLSFPAALIERYFPGMGSGSSDPIFSASGWMAVLMVFVLGRVFAVGSAMRDELEGTV